MATDRAMLWPMFAMAALSFGVMLALMRRRIGEIRARRIPLRTIATSRGMTALEDVAPADNFRNLFEMPVLFYAACMVVTVAHATTAPLVALAWTYVVLRALHTAIHLGANRVRHRFLAFAASAIVLLALWVLAAHALLQGR